MFYQSAIMCQNRSGIGHRHRADSGAVLAFHYILWHIDRRPTIEHRIGQSKPSMFYVVTNVDWHLSPFPSLSSLWSWWRHQMETFSALLTICAENSPVPGEFIAQRPVARSFDVIFDLRLNKRLSKQWWGWWFETLSHPLWRHRNISPQILVHVYATTAQLSCHVQQS